MRDHLVRWHQQYADRGLVIIEIDGGKFEKLDRVKRDVAKKGVKHLVLWDDNCQNTATYGVTAWPVAYLIGIDGRVVWEGNPARVVNRPALAKALKDRIERQLKTVEQKQKTRRVTREAIRSAKPAKPLF